MRTETSALLPVGRFEEKPPTLLACIAEFERELIRERIGERRKRAMAAGVKFVRNAS
jgi:hypothetical protein